MNLLLWTADKFGRPTFRNLTDSYESWAYRNRFFTQVSKLKSRRFLERDAASPEDRLYRLTARGRLHALGGRDPEERWSRKWDGRWRIAVFDVPLAHDTHRARLRRYFRDKHFGYLQNSVWITPDPLDDERKLLAGGSVNVESLILLEARPCTGESDADIVAGAWDFKRINDCYARHLKILERRPDGALHGEKSAKALLEWAREERAAWLEAVMQDPLLPEEILPSSYLGQKAWRRRAEAIARAGRQLPTFGPG